VVSFVQNFGLKTCSTALFEKNEIAALNKAGLKSIDNSKGNGKPATNNIWCFKNLTKRPRKEATFIFYEHRDQPESDQTVQRKV
jgi:hypothetical protein